MKAKLTKSNAIKVFKLLEQWTRAEIMGRHGPFETSDLSFIDFTLEHSKKEDEIRTLLFGTHNLVELGIEWGLLKTCDFGESRNRIKPKMKSKKVKKSAHRKITKKRHRP